MAYHGVFIPTAIAATNVDAFIRNGVSASPVDNGFIVRLGAKSSAVGESEVFLATVPTTGSGLTGAYMVYQGDEVVVTDGRYKGLDPDPRNFFVAEGVVFSCFKPQIGDRITVTADALSASLPGATYTHVNATTDTMKLTWGTTQTASVMSWKLVQTTYISLATGAIGNQRSIAYELECVAV